MDLPWFPGAVLILSGIFILAGARRRWKIVRMPALKWTEFHIASNNLFRWGFIIAGLVMLVKLVF